VLPLLGALCAWGLRFAPRVGAALAALTLAAGAWVLLGVRVGSGTLAPLHGDVPWGGLERVLPRFGGAPLRGEAAVWVAAVGVAIAALALREARARRGGRLVKTW
jgi:hypothetical protein